MLLRRQIERMCPRPPRRLHSPHLLDVSDSVYETATINLPKEGSMDKTLDPASCGWRSLAPAFTRLRTPPQAYLKPLTSPALGTCRTRGMGNECAWGGACPAHPSPSLPLLTHYTPLLRGVTLRGKVSAVAWGGELEQEVRTSLYLFCATSRPPALHPSSPSFSSPSPPARTPPAAPSGMVGMCVSPRAAGIHMRLRRNQWLRRRQSYALAALPTHCLRERHLRARWARCTPPSLRLAPPFLPSHTFAHSDADAMPVPRARGDGAECGAWFLDVRASASCARAEFARTSCAGMLIPSHSLLLSSSPPSLPLSHSVPYAAYRM
ncbi:hypothetical protein C8F04DRAFT_1142885 [Mycena alexandri]|uniref:Uncharacterized protein n=1 Tax=Mycena alexandri TaxID=1745969 RepID=A0AAD6S491_9AGAR|nr:hypothetical protein C8F04DRAFT_1142885 [Mycena alexandri]